MPSRPVFPATTRTDDTPGANPVSWGGTACTLRVVPRNSEQPSALLSFLHRARDLERGHDRHDVGIWRTLRAISLAEVLSWGSVIGQRAASDRQLPVVLRLLRGLHLSFAFHWKTCARSFGISSLCS